MSFKLKKASSQLDNTISPTRKLKLPPKDESVNQVPLTYKHPGHIYAIEDDIKDPVVLQVRLYRNMINRKEMIRMSDLAPAEDPKKKRRNPDHANDEVETVPKGMTTDHNGKLLKIKSKVDIGVPVRQSNLKTLKNIFVNDETSVSKPLQLGRSLTSMAAEKIKDVAKQQQAMI